MLRCFIVIKLLQLAVVLGTPTRFDVSSEILESIYPIDLPVLGSILKKLLVWDNVHYSEIFHNQLKYEHQFVFSPGWTGAVRYVCGVMGVTGFYNTYFVAVVLANLCQLVGAYVIYYYTISLFNRVSLFKTRAKDIALLAGQYYVLSPGGIFLTSGYAESLGSLIAFVGLYLRQVSIGHNNNYAVDITNKLLYVVSGVVLSYAFTVRANLLLLGVFYLYDLWFFRHNVVNVMVSICSGTPLFYQLVKAQYVAYTVFCPGRGEWCNNTIPSLFQYCQTYYWNNGFLNYWSLNNIPNFILALPIVCCNLYLIVWFHRYPAREFVPYLIVNGVVMVVGLLFWNVQILTRITNFNPIFYWFLALNDNRGVKLVLVYWIVIQTGLFASFLPPA